MWQLEFADGTLTDVPWEGLLLRKSPRREGCPVVFPRGDTLVVATTREGLEVDGRHVSGVSPLTDGATLTLGTGTARVRRSAAPRTRTRETPMARLPVHARVEPRVFSNSEAMNAFLRERFKPRVRDLGRAGQLEISSGWSGVSLNVAKVKVWDLDTMTLIEEGRRVFMFDPQNQGVFSTNGLREQLTRAVRWASSPPSPEAVLDFLELVTHAPADVTTRASSSAAKTTSGAACGTRRCSTARAVGMSSHLSHNVDPWPLDAVRAWHPPRIVDGCVEAFVYEVQTGDAATVRVDPRGTVAFVAQPQVSAPASWRHG